MGVGTSQLDEKNKNAGHVCIQPTRRSVWAAPLAKADMGVGRVLSASYNLQHHSSGIQTRKMFAVQGHQETRHRLTHSVPAGDRVVGTTDLRMVTEMWQRG